MILDPKVWLRKMLIGRIFGAQTTSAWTNATGSKSECAALLSCVNKSVFEPVTYILGHKIYRLSH